MVGKLCGTFSVKQRLHEPQIYQALVEKCTNRSVVSSYLPGSISRMEELLPQNIKTNDFNLLLERYVINTLLNF